MPILQIALNSSHALELQQHCAECGAVNVVPVPSLNLGAGRSPDQIALPPCACGATEFLVQTFDEAPTGFKAHRSVVNSLASHLKSSGRIADEHKEAVGADKRVPKDVGPLLASVPVIPDLPAPNGLPP